MSSPLLALPASAAGSNWWYDTYEVAAVHAEGWTGEGVKIALLDNQINPDLPVFDGQNLTVADGTLCADAGEPTTTDPNFRAIHGTTLAAYLIGNGTGAGEVQGIAPDAELTFYATGDREARGETCDAAAEHPWELSWYGLGLQRAIDDGARIIVNASSLQPSPFDADVVANAIAKGVVLVDATPNSRIGEVLGVTEYAWDFNGVVASSAVDSTGELQSDSAGERLAFPETTVVAAGIDLPTVGSDEGGGWDGSFQTSGSSFAAPLVAGMLAVVAQRYPDATGNQLVQSLIHNTGREDRPLEDDPTGGYGYGAAWLTHLLREDPAQYPDVNPLMNKATGEPTAEQVEAAAARGSALPAFDDTGDGNASATTAPVPDGPSAEDPAPGASSPLVTVLIVVIAIIIIGAVVVTIVLLTVRRRKTPQGGTP